MTFCYLLPPLCPRLWFWFVFIVSLFPDLNNDRFVSHITNDSNSRLVTRQSNSLPGVLNRPFFRPHVQSWERGCRKIQKPPVYFGIARTRLGKRLCVDRGHRFQGEDGGCAGQKGETTDMGHGRTGALPFHHTRVLQRSNGISTHV